MKRFLLGSVGLVALMAAGSANAADLPIYKAPPPVMVAPPSWTACYIGAHVGAGWGTKQWEDNGGDDFSDNTSYGVNGFLGGGQIGCDYQFWGPVVVGIEGSYSGSDIKGSSHLPFENEESIFSSRIRGIATVTGRVGFTADKALIYVKGGGAWARESHTLTEIPVTDEFLQVSQNLSSTRNGWLVGTGIEYLIAPNWSAKLEYNYMDFGSKTYFFDQLADDSVTNKQQLHSIKFGVNYRFGWWGKGPVVANY